MVIALDHGTIQLAGGSSARVARICGARLECLDGTAWITLDNDPRDIVLTRGESFVVDSNAALIVTALSAPARVTLNAADPAAMPCRQPRRVRHGLIDMIRQRLVADALAPV